MRLRDVLQPPNWDAAPEGEPLCPKCEGAEARLAAESALVEILQERGVEERAVLAIMGRWVGALDEIADEVARVTREDGGRGCGLCYPRDED